MLLMQKIIICYFINTTEFSDTFIQVIEARKLERQLNKQNYDHENNISNETNKDDQVVKSGI